MERIRCPRCSLVFQARERPRCPKCGLTGRVRPEAPPATRRAAGRARRTDRVVAAVAVVALLLMAGLVSLLLYGGDTPDPGTPDATADVSGDLRGIPGLGGDGNATPPSQVTTITDNATVGGAGPTGDDPPPLAFEGTGDDVTGSFVTERGLLRLELTYRGEGFFRATFIHLDDENATRRAVAAPDRGDYDGSRYFALAPGRYTLDVTSGDDASAWQVRIEQPGAADADPLPAHRTGAGDAAGMVVWMDAGEVSFRTTHTAQLGEFVVRLYDAQGNLVRRGGSEAVVSDYGDHEGFTRLSIPVDGAYFVDVQAAGDWSLTVS